MYFPYSKYHASGTCREVSLGALSAPFWLPFLLLLSPLSLQSHQKNNSGKQEKKRGTKTPKSDKSETPEASQRVTLSWGNLADWTIRSVLGCKGYPRIVPGLLRTPFSSILATKTIHCTSVLTDAQPTRFPNKYMPSFPLSSFKTTLLPIRFETWQAHDVYLRSRCYDMSYILYNMNHNIYIYIYVHNIMFRGSRCPHKVRNTGAAVLRLA